MTAKILVIESFLIGLVVIISTQGFAASAPGITTIVTAALMGIAAVIMAWAALKTAAAKAAEPVLATVTRMEPVLGKVEANVNSKATEYVGVIAAQKIEITILRETLDEFKKSMAVLAQARAAEDLTRAISRAAVAGATAPASRPSITLAGEPVLQAIEKNTKEIASNTKTDETVQELKDQL